MAVTSFFVGAIAVELLKELAKICKKSSSFKAAAELLMQDINKILPNFREIQYSGVELPQIQIEGVIENLKEGLELCVKIVSSTRWNVYKNLQSESCSFLESNDDDSSSTTTDPMYVISPSARFKSWTKGSLLGSGSFGTVFEGLSDDGFFFAVKEVSLLDQGSQARQSIYQLEQEISLLSQFEHENIVQYLGTDKDEEKLYIFLELVTKGSLAQTYQKYNLQDHHVSAYTKQILHGVMYLHDRNVVHRDIKCANILVDANGSVKLADFGLAKATKLNDVKSCKGTAFWMAPEVVNRKGSGYGLAADIWSLGCTVLEMLTRQMPYSHLEGMQALFRIGKGEPPPIPNSISKTARDFILRCLRVKADDRPTAAQLLEHPFVKRSLPLPSAGPASPSHPNWRRL
ncbi:mitogen-activated protein kinase kinase kinase [Ranunculus cassubicifolius]